MPRVLQADHARRIIKRIEEKAVPRNKNAAEDQADQTKEPQAPARLFFTEEQPDKDREQQQKQG